MLPNVWRNLILSLLRRWLWQQSDDYCAPWLASGYHQLPCETHGVAWSLRLPWLYLPWLSNHWMCCSLFKFVSIYFFCTVQFHLNDNGYQPSTSSLYQAFRNFVCRLRWVEHIPDSRGTAPFTSCSSFPEQQHMGPVIVPGQGNDMYIFPGLLSYPYRLFACVFRPSGLRPSANLALASYSWPVKLFSSVLSTHWTRRNELPSISQRKMSSSHSSIPRWVESLMAFPHNLPTHTLIDLCKYCMLC